MNKLSTASPSDATLHETLHDPVAGPWPWTFPIVAGDITNDAKDFVIEADATLHAAIAAALNVLSVEKIVSTMRIHRTKNSIRVRGHVDAVLEQSCVVTLQPVRQTVHEDIDRTFIAKASDFDPVFAKMNSNREMLIDPDEVDPPEIIENGRLDLAAIAMEHVIIGMDLYPRAPDADLADVATPALTETDDVERESPFAALAKLKSMGNG